MASYKHDAELIHAAIYQSGGNVSAVARRLSCDWHTAKKAVTRTKALQRAWEAEKQSTIDLAEEKLLEAILQGEAWAIKFYLSTIGKGRGYGPDTDSSSDPITIKVEYANQ